MLQELKKYLPKRLQNTRIPEKEAGAAYDIWSASYDNQPGNLMLDLDEIVFSRLLKGIILKDKKVGDIGCGTGRHWAKLLKQEPEQLSGFDVSVGMLSSLLEKYPGAEARIISDDNLLNIPDESFDVIVSTLTVAHIEKLEQALSAWCRILKSGGGIIITDFHPDALAIGGQRTFKHENKHIAVRNFVHKTEAIKAFFAAHNFELVQDEQIVIDESVKHYYEQQNALHVYDKFKGMPIIYGLHFKQKS